MSVPRHRAPSYAVLWSEGPCAIEAGRLELGPETLRFDGRQGCVRRVPYDDIEAVRIGYRTGERLRGKPALLVSRLDGVTFRIGSLDRVGTVRDLEGELTRLSRWAGAESA